MIREEAYEAMVKGYAVKHTLFGKNEYLYMDDMYIIRDEDSNEFENDWDVNSSPEWLTGWSIYKGRKQDIRKQEQYILGLEEEPIPALKISTSNLYGVINNDNIVSENTNTIEIPTEYITNTNDDKIITDTILKFIIPTISICIIIISMLIIMIMVNMDMSTLSTIVPLVIVIIMQANLFIFITWYYRKIYKGGK